MGKKPYNYEKKISIEKALLEFDPTLVAFDYGTIAVKKNKSEEDIKREFQKLELNTTDGEPEINIEIFDYHVAISIPFSYKGDEAKKAFQKLKAYIRIIRETAGYFVYDPQAGEAYDSIDNKFNGIGKYLSVSESMKGILKSAKQTEKKKPWWKF